MNTQRLNIDRSVKTTKNGNIKQSVVTVTRKKANTKVSFKEVRKLYDYLIKEKKVNPEDVYIQVMTNRELTLKALNDDDLKDWDDEEYYENRVKQVGPALNKFEYARIVILSSH